MARYNFLGRAVDTYGNSQPSEGITIYLTGTTTPATIYTVRTDGTGISTAPQITSDAYGRFNFYVDDGDYPLAGNQKFDVVAAGLKYPDIEIMRGVKVHHALEELLDDDHPQYASRDHNETINGNWQFTSSVSAGETPTKDNHLTRKDYVDLEILNSSTTLSKSLSAASVEQDKREHAFTLTASASLYENIDTQILSVSAASIEANRTHKIWADTMFASTSAASVEADRTHKIWADTMFASVSAASKEQDKRASKADETHIAWAEAMFASTSAASVEANRTHKIWADTMFASTSAASKGQDKREHAFTLSASASLYENLNTQILSISASSVEQDKHNRRWANDLFVSTSAASVEADRTHKIWTDTMFASVSAASVEQDKRLRTDIDINTTQILSVSAASRSGDNRLSEDITTNTTQILSVSASSVEQDRREHAFTLSASASLYKNLNTQIASISAASVEEDRTHKIWADTMFASVSAASVEQDNRLQESIDTNTTNIATNVTEIISVSAASLAGDRQLQYNIDNLTSDHGELDGLEDDDHSQYYNEARGDARYANISVSAASVEADRTHRQWADTMFASVSAASKEQDKREREQTNVQIISVSAASVEADRTHKIWADTMFASVSAASKEQDKRERAFTLSSSAALYENLNVQIVSVSAASREQDNRLREYVDESAGGDGGDGGFSNKIVEGDSGVVVNDGGTGTITLSADSSTIAILKKDNNTWYNPTYVLDKFTFTNPQVSAGIAIDHNNEYNRTTIDYFDESAWYYPIQIADSEDDVSLTLTSGIVGMNIIKANYFKGYLGTDITEFSIDGTLAGESDNAVPTEKAVKTYVETYVDDILTGGEDQVGLIKTGTYTGDGSVSQAITGIGFQPKYVIVWQHPTTAENYAGASRYAAKLDQSWSTFAEVDRGTSRGIGDNMIISLDADGFTVDDGAGDFHPNKNTTTYDYLAIGSKTVQTYAALNTSSYVKVSDVKADATDAGTFTQDAWQTRVLNTEDNDPDGICSLASNQITLDAGTYECRIICPAFKVNSHQARLQNVTAGTTIIVGSPEYAANATSISNTSKIQGRFTIAANQAIEVQHRCQTTQNTNGFGIGSAVFGVSNVYAVAEFWKIHEGGAQEGVGFNSRMYATRAAVQSIPNTTWTKVQLNTEVFDGLGEYDNVTNYRFTANTAGYYQVSGSVGMTSLGDGKSVYLGIYKNGSVHFNSRADVGVACNAHINCSGLIYLAANEYVELWVYHNHGGAINTSASVNSLWMTIHRLS